VDAAHGAAYHVGPAVFHELGAEVIPMGAAPNGLNINEGVGATSPQALVERVKREHADYGIALDGDADRLLVVDGSGRLFNGDELLYVMVNDRLAQGQKVPGAVGTLMTNLAVEKALLARDVQFVRAKVGDRYVLEELTQRGWELGGEGSGHLLALDKHSTGDGIVSALLVLQSVARSGLSLAEQLQGVTLLPQILRNVRLREGLNWMEHSGFESARKDVLSQLGQQGRLLVRASGTEPVLRVMVEAADENLAARCVERLVASLA